MLSYSSSRGFVIARLDPRALITRLAQIRFAFERKMFAVATRLNSEATLEGATESITALEAD